MQNKKTAAIWCTALTLLTVGACSSDDGTPNGDGDGTGGGNSTGGTEGPGGTGGTVQSTGGTSTSTGGGFTGTGGMGGDPPGAPDCADAPILTTEQTTYANFEGLSTVEDPPTFKIQTADAGVYWYDDASGATAVQDFVPGIEGEQALHIGYMPALWGAGTGLYSTCVNAQVFDGISFWVKGEMPEGSALQVELHVPETTSADNASGTGLCFGAPGNDCLPNKAAVEQVTGEWVQHFITWDQFIGGSNFGTPVPLNTATLNGLNFHVPGSSGTIDLSVDDVQFFVGDGGMGGAGGMGGGGG